MTSSPFRMMKILSFREERRMMESRHERKVPIFVPPIARYHTRSSAIQYPHDTTSIRIYLNELIPIDPSSLVSLRPNKPPYSQPHAISFDFQFQNRVHPTSTAPPNLIFASQTHVTPDCSSGHLHLHLFTPQTVDQAQPRIVRRLPPFHLIASCWAFAILACESGCIA